MPSSRLPWEPPLPAGEKPLSGGTSRRDRRGGGRA